MEKIASNKVATASQRQQLQETFDRAQRLKRGTHEEQVLAGELFRQCFANDPGNLIYAQAWLNSLEDRSAIAGPKRPVRGFVLSRTLKKAEARGEWSQVIDLASSCLETNQKNVKPLLTLAQACSELAHESVTISLLRRAAAIEESCGEAWHRLAVALEDVRDFAAARQCWLRVKELSPNNEVAHRALAALGQATNNSPSACEPSETTIPESVDDCLRQVDALVSHGQFAEADQYLSRALSLFGSDIRIRERAEQLLIDQVQYEIGVAENRFQGDATSQHQDLLDSLRGELNRREIDFYATRSQRYPDQMQLKLELGLRLKRAGILAEAIKEFERLLTHEALLWDATVETGECWQGLRQFDRALDFYQNAVQNCPESQECYKRARYRAAVLLEAMGDGGQAETLLEELVRIDPVYKDSATRLDRIRKIRHDT